MLFTFVAAFVVFTITAVQLLCRWQRSVQRRLDDRAAMQTRVKS